MELTQCAVKPGKRADTRVSTSHPASHSISAWVTASGSAPVAQRVEPME